jgi:hypothetical protein
MSPPVPASTAGPQALFFVTICRRAGVAVTC